jgi:hypothetical protein
MAEMDRARLGDLLVVPREDLGIEIKNWLGLQGSNDDKATFAKAVLAIANHGGGFVVFGLVETQAGFSEAEGRPADLTGFSQDLINGIVQNYCDPAFHCPVHFVASPTDEIFPIVVVPGGHRVPIRAKRAGPNGNTVTNNAIYMRKPGPRSETPQTGQDWDELLGRCFQNRRDEMFDQIRALMIGAVPQVEQAPQPAPLDDFIEVGFQRWRQLAAQAPAGSGPRFEHGRYSFAFEIIGERRQMAPAQFPEVLRASEVRWSGWPPFWYPTRAGIAPYPIDGLVECWLGADDQTPPEQRDPGHSDFWRVHPDGRAILIRGFQEDGSDGQRPGLEESQPGTLFDVTLPVWRVGEALLYAKSLSDHLFEGPTTIIFEAIYQGLAGRDLTSVTGRRMVRGGRVARQDEIRLRTHVDTGTIDSNLPEIVHPLLSPLYALFDFFELSMQLVNEEIASMRGRRG